MRKVIALIISIAMLAGLAINCLAKGGGSLLSIETPDGKDHQWDTSDSNEKTGNGNVAGIVVTTSTNGFAINITSDVTIDKLKVDEASLEINIASGKKLTVSTTDDESNAIEIGKDLTITGGGTLETKYTSTYGIKATNNIIISNCNVTANGNGFGITAVENITITDSKVTSNSTEGCAIGAVSGVTIDGSIVTATSSGYYGIASTDSGDIIIKNKSTVTASGDGAIFADNDITIDGSIVTASGNSAIFAFGDVIIDDSTVTADATEMGIFAENSLNINTTDKEVKAKGTYAFVTRNENGIAVNGVSITDAIVGEHFTGAAGYGNKSGAFAVTGTDFVTVKYSSDPEEDLDDEIEESADDPDVELDFGYGPVTVKTSNKTLVLNDKKLFEVSIGEGDVFIPVDLSSAPKKIDGLFFNNEVYKYIDNAGKDIKIINRFAYAEVYTNKEVGNNPLSLHLSDVSEIAGTCATAIQKAAMQTSKVYAEVNYSFVSNGKPTDNNAKIYVPVDGPAKVFYLFNAEKIGIVPCEVKDGYCEFNRYFDGTYVVCAK